MTFPMIASKGRVLLWSAAFVLLWAAPAHAADFSGHVVSILDGDTIEVLHNNHPERIRLSDIDCLRRAKPSASERSRPLQHSHSGKKSSSRPTATTSIITSLETCFCPMP